MTAPFMTPAETPLRGAEGPPASFPWVGRAPTPVLRPSEEAVFRLLATGLTYEQAAYARGTAVWTLKAQTGRVYERLGTGGLVGTLWDIGWIVLP